jgi:hypothetical protein
MGAPITAKAGTLDVGTPIALFHTRILGGGANMIGRNHQYDVAPDGRILMNVVAGEGDTAPITIVLNWTPR